MSLRRALVKTEKFVDDNWVVIRYEDIKKGDIFRTYVDAEGTKLASDNKGNSSFKATKDAYTENGFDYSVDCQPV